MQVPVAFTFFLTGLAGSVGPCIAPRFIAAASLAADDDPRRGQMHVIALFFGIVSGYVALGACSSILLQTARYSSAVYAMLAAILVLSGIRSLTSGDHRCHSENDRAARSAGGAYLIGVSSVVVISPCCAPLVGAATLLASGKGPFESYALIASFAFGHALPVLIAGTTCTFASLLAAATRAQQALRLAGAALTIALGGYFAVLV